MTTFEGTNRVTSKYGYREIRKNGRLCKETHRGHDIVPTRFSGETVPESAWNVREVTGGTVKKIGYDRSRGNYLDITTAPGIFERYQHLLKIYVRAGQKVEQGDIIALAGNTGDSIGRHLHFGVYKGGSAEWNAIDPSLWDGLPNKAGTYAGNNNKDGIPPMPAPKLKNWKISGANAGDSKKIKGFAAGLKLDCTEV